MQLLGKWLQHLGGCVCPPDPLLPETLYSGQPPLISTISSATAVPAETKQLQPIFKFKTYVEKMPAFKDSCVKISIRLLWKHPPVSEDLGGAPHPSPKFYSVLLIEATVQVQTLYI